MKKPFAILLTLCLIMGMQTAFAQESGDGSQGAAQWTYLLPLSSVLSPYCVLADRDHLLAEDYVPSALVTLSTVKKTSSSNISLEKMAAKALEDLFLAAEQEDVILYLKSGYRSYGTQKTMYRNRLEAQGRDDGVVAMPGASDHQTGLGCDVLNADFAGKPRMTAEFGLSKEGIWLAENCSQYGFIIRYPEGKEDITNTIYEPWHLRYVGEDVAGYITRSELTLEEFTQEWEQALAAFEQAGGDRQAQLLYEEDHKSVGPSVLYLDEFASDGEGEVSLIY